MKLKIINLLVFFLVGMFVITPVGADTRWITSPYPNGEVVGSFYRVVEKDFEIVNESSGEPETINFRFSYYTVDPIDITQWKTVIFRIETNSPVELRLSKIYKSQIVINGILHGAVVDESWITINHFNQPVLDNEHYFQADSTFRPYMVDIGQIRCFGTSAGYVYSEKCHSMDIYAPLPISKQAYKGSLGVKLVWEVGIQIPTDNNSFYERTLSDHYCIAKNEYDSDNRLLKIEANRLLKNCNQGTSLNDLGQQDEPETPGFELGVLVLGLIVLGVIYKKKRMR